MISLKDLYSYTSMKEHAMDDQEDDTLSLSDLPIYSHSSSDVSNTNSSEHDQSENDSFEFFTADFRLQSHPDIVFCGRSIPCRETPTYQGRCYTVSSSHRKRIRYLFSRIKGFSSSKKPKVVAEKLADITGKNTNNHASKSKWCLLVFGFQKYSVPTKIELDDMKYRQNRRSAKSLEMLERSNSTDASNSKLDKNLSYLLRSLSCSSNHSLNVLD